jgi:tetratricopeptide (TPR) repeat protein
LEFQEKAIQLDPEFASAYAGIAFSVYVQVIMGCSQDRAGDLKRGLEAGLKAVSLDENDPFAHVGLGRVHIARAEHEKAIASFDSAIELNPSFALAYYGKAHSLWHCGYPDRAVISHDEAIRLSPRDPLMWTFLASKAIALFMLERYDESLDCSHRAQQYPINAIWAYMGELSTLGILKRKKEAEDALERALKIQPDLSVSFIKQALPITHVPSSDHFFEGLIKAGVPE